MSRVDCAREVALWPLLMFAFGAIVLTCLIARHNGFGLKDALAAATGRKGFERSLAINLVWLATMLLPLLFWVWLMGRC